MVFLMHCRALFQTSQLLRFDRETRVLGLFSSSQGQVLISQGHNQDLKVFACEQNSIWSHDEYFKLWRSNQCIKHGLYVLLTTLIGISYNGRVWEACHGPE